MHTYLCDEYKLFELQIEIYWMNKYLYIKLAFISHNSIINILYIYIGYKMVNLLNQYAILLSNCFFETLSASSQDYLYVIYLPYNALEPLCMSIYYNNEFLIFLEISQNLIIGNV